MEAAWQLSSSTSMAADKKKGGREKQIGAHFHLYCIGS